ncbi:MAG: hypothetical protein V3T81_03820 [Thermoanaerobaculia bacterium]
MTPGLDEAPTLSLSLGPLQAQVDARLDEWRQQRFSERLWRKDPRLWAAEEVPELTDRLGWLDLPHAMAGELASLERLALGLRRDGVREVVLLGMGGSSLAPEVFERTFGSAPGHPNLRILDTTHPEAIRSLAESLDPATTSFLVSSKSGTTTETLSLLSYFWEWAAEDLPEPGGRFVAITDGGSPLAELAEERAFRAVLQAPSEVGGRFSALSHFGLAPAAILGIDLRRLLEGARKMARRCSAEAPAGANPGLLLGAVLAEAALAGRDKLTLLTTPSLDSFPDWIEQLVAESTGKEGKGLLPVVREPAADPSRYGADRLFIGLSVDGDGGQELEERARGLEAVGHPVARIRLRDRYDLGAEIFRWQVAVAAAGAALGVHPFNQPDVQLAKEMAARAMRGASDTEAPEERLAPVPSADSSFLGEAVEKWLAGCREGDYIALQAYLAPSPETERALARLQACLLERTGCASTLGFGPRFLHSTGQLHKGGPDRGLFLQLLDRPPSDLAVPQAGHGFARLISAQAAGDADALAQRGRRLLRVDLGDRVADGLAKLLEAVCD